MTWAQDRVTHTRIGQSSHLQVLPRKPSTQDLSSRVVLTGGSMDRGEGHRLGKPAVAVVGWVLS